MKGFTIYLIKEPTCELFIECDSFQEAERELSNLRNCYPTFEFVIIEDKK